MSYDNSNETQCLDTKKYWRILFITIYLPTLGNAKDGNVFLPEKIDQLLKPDSWSRTSSNNLITEVQKIFY